MHYVGLYILVYSVYILVYYVGLYILVLSTPFAISVFTLGLFAMEFRDQISCFLQQPPFADCLQKPAVEDLILRMLTLL